MTDSALYTRTGDAGQTSLGSGRRVPKTNGTLEVLGNIDELESAIGLAKASVPQGDFNLQEGLSTVQKQLLVLKEDLRSFGSSRSLKASDVEYLEKQIDAYGYCAAEKDPKQLPGKTDLAAKLDLARSIARRMERSLSKAGLPSALHQKYANRLSDYLYAAARYAEVQESVPASASAAAPAPAVHPKKPLSLKLAKAVLEAMELVAENRGLRLVFAICDGSGHPIAVHVMEDAFIASYDIAVNKAWTAVSLKMPTKDLVELCRPDGSLYGLQFTNNGKVVIFGGGVPLKDETGAIIGGFGVSGSTAEIDTQMGDIGGEIFNELYQKGSTCW